MIENVIIIGAGNLATQLAMALAEKGIIVKQVFSRNLDSARELADKTGAAFTNDLSQLLAEADLYLIAVKDSAIQEVLENISLDESRMIVHTAGSVPMNILDGFSKNYGVFYPVQTFSKNRQIDFSDIPICIEANHPANLMELQELGEKLSGSVHQINTDDRKALHLAAIFTNNFVNHFYSIGENLLQNKKLNFDLLIPLIYETAEKIKSLPPAEAQTGPAKRNDQIIINAHIKMLQDQPDLQKIYRLMSESIFQFHQNQKHDLF